MFLAPDDSRLVVYGIASNSIPFLDPFHSAFVVLGNPALSTSNSIPFLDPFHPCPTGATAASGPLLPTPFLF
jgi:hypothetical protein